MLLKGYKGIVLNNKWEGTLGQAMLIVDICPLNRVNIGYPRLCLPRNFPSLPFPSLSSLLLPSSLPAILSPLTSPLLSLSLFQVRKRPSLILLISGLSRETLISWRRLSQRRLHRFWGGMETVPQEE